MLDGAATYRQGCRCHADTKSTHPEVEVALVSAVDGGGASPEAYQGTRPTVCSQLILFHRIEVQSVSTRPPVSPAVVRLGGVNLRVWASKHAMDAAAVS